MGELKDKMEKSATKLMGKKYHHTNLDFINKLTDLVIEYIDKLEVTHMIGHLEIAKMSVFSQSRTVLKRLKEEDDGDVRYIG